MIPHYFWREDVIASPNDDYRYWLSRDTVWPVDATKPPVTREMLIFGMLNPSKARGEGVGDPTQRRCNGFAARLGARRYGIVNLFAASTPYPEELFTFGYESAIGAFNDEVVSRVLELCKARSWPFVAAWGTCSKLPVSEKALVRERARELVGMSRRIGVTLHCLEATSDGTPRHPLMLGYEHSKLLQWDQAQ